MKQNKTERQAGWERARQCLCGQEGVLVNTSMDRSVDMIQKLSKPSVTVQFSGLLVKYMSDTAGWIPC